MFFFLQRLFDIFQKKRWIPRIQLHFLERIRNSWDYFHKAWKRFTIKTFILINFFFLLHSFIARIVQSQQREKLYSKRWKKKRKFNLNSTSWKNENERCVGERDGNMYRMERPFSFIHYIYLITEKHFKHVSTRFLFFSLVLSVSTWVLFSFCI